MSSRALAKLRESAWPDDAYLCIEELGKMRLHAPTQIHRSKGSNSRAIRASSLEATDSGRKPEPTPLCYPLSEGRFKLGSGFSPSTAFEGHGCMEMTMNWARTCSADLPRHRLNQAHENPQIYDGSQSSSAPFFNKLQWIKTSGSNRWQAAWPKSWEAYGV